MEQAVRHSQDRLISLQNSRLLQKQRKLFMCKHWDIYELETQFDLSVGIVHTAVRRLGNDNVPTQ